MNSPINIRPARLDDLPALLALEQQRFTTDRISARSFRRWLRQNHGGLAVGESGGTLLGDVLVLRRRGSRVARLYSIAVDQAAGGRGLGRMLLAWAEQRAISWGARVMRLEVQPDNASALALYRKAGYRLLETLPAFYEDGGDALRMQKQLRGGSRGRAQSSVLR